MKFIKSFIFLFIIFISSLILFSGCSKKNNDSIQNLENYSIDWVSYDKIENIQTNNEKFIMLFFYADWCSYCKKMESTTFTNKEVIELLNNKFFSVKINGESNKPLSAINKNITGINLLRAYQITGFPTMVFLDREGKPLTALPGYVDSDLFIDILKYIYTESYKTMDFDSFKANLK